jgi:Domain of unknown function (DUF5668)
MTDPAPGGAETRATTDRSKGRDLGGLVFGLFLVVVGGYFLLTDTLGIDLPNIGEFWPVFVIGLGAWILLSAMRSDRS